MCLAFKLFYLCEFVLANLQVSQTGAVNDQMPQYTQPLRELQQVGQITKVDTAARLKDAIDKGAEHIELESHMDLTDLDMIEGNSLLGTLPESIKSIRVRFSLHVLVPVSWRQ